MTKLYCNSKIIKENAETAMSFSSRLIGLMGRKDIAPDYALVFQRCGAIHTFFMAAAIDVVMADREGRVICLKENMKPWGFLGCAGAVTTVEMKAGSIMEKGIKRGDLISISS